MEALQGVKLTCTNCPCGLIIQRLSCFKVVRSRIDSDNKIIKNKMLIRVALWTLNSYEYFYIAFSKLVKNMMLIDSYHIDQFLLGDNSDTVPPDSIPNSEVKRISGDGSVGLPHVRVAHRQAPITKKGLP